MDLALLGLTVYGLWCPGDAVDGPRSSLLFFCNTKHRRFWTKTVDVRHIVSTAFARSPAKTVIYGFTFSCNIDGFGPKQSMTLTMWVLGCGMCAS